MYRKINQNKLKLNVSKTKLMLITRKRNIGTDLFNVYIDSDRLEFSDEVKYLGVIIDKNLNFKLNCNYVIRKMALKAGILKRTGSKFNMQQKIQIYKTTIEPHVNYCSSILYLLGDGDIARIQKIQNKCMRDILRVNWRQICYVL